MTATILIVDDVPQNVKLLEAKLKNEYYDVITAKNGFEALEQVKKHPIDLILLDVMMPEMDGFQCCRKLKEDHTTSHIPVVMVTALNQMEDRVEGLRAGADDFLTKPIKEMPLLARIRSLVRVKIILDELRVRNKTSLEFGVNTQALNDGDKIIKAKVLLIDDDVAQAKQITTKLQEADLNVESMADNLTQVSEKVTNSDYDLVIISTQLTDIEGLRICSQLKSHEQTRNIPLLILVDEGDEKLLIKALDMGVNDYLITPIDSNEIEARVKTQIKRKKYQDALKENYEQNISMALTDGLTGLYNRRYFDVHLKQLLHQTKNVVLLLLDLDFFKKVNDTYGHLAGDEVLKELANRIRISTRITDLGARYGGEEFAVILPNTEASEALQVAERIRMTIAGVPFKLSMAPFEISNTASIGVTLSTPQDTVETLIQRADKALYQSKAEGRNKVTIL